MATYGYVRVSTQRQADEGESLAVQQRQIKGYATMIGVEAPQFFVEEGVSGTKPLGERPAGRELLAKLYSAATSSFAPSSTGCFALRLMRSPWSRRSRKRASRFT